MRTKRRRKYTWFPVIGTDGPSDDDFSARGGQLSVLADGSTSATIIPLVPDVPMEGTEIDPDAAGQLVQAIGQEYVIERIVGKFFCAYAGPADDTGVIFPKTAWVGAGLFVARAADRQAGGGQNVPIGAASLIEIQENYSPLSPEVIREPFMWRRTWILSSGRPVSTPQSLQNPFSSSPQQPGFVFADQSWTFNESAPRFNGRYGSVADGPHVDVKSVRKVGNDERLWLIVAVRTLDTLFTGGQSPTNGATSGLGFWFDYRVLGQLRRARNRSNF